MTAAALAENPLAVGTVFYEKKVQAAQYEPETFSHSVQYFIDPEDNEASIRAKKKDAAFEVKSTVYEQLGVDYEIKDGIAVALVKDAFPGTRSVSEHPVTAGQSVNVPVPAGHVPPSDGEVSATPPHDPHPLAKARKDMSPVEKAMSKENQSWAEARFRQHPDEFFDNREAKNAPNGNQYWPDFKHKTTGIGFYVD